KSLKKTKDNAKQYLTKPRPPAGAPCFSRVGKIEREGRVRFSGHRWGRRLGRVPSTRIEALRLAGKHVGTATGVFNRRAQAPPLSSAPPGPGSPAAAPADFPGGSGTAGSGGAWRRRRARAASAPDASCRYEPGCRGAE